MSLISLLITVLIFCLIFWAIRMLMAAFGMPPQFQVVVTIVFVVIVCLWLLSVVGGLAGGTGPVFRTR